MDIGYIGLQYNAGHCRPHLSSYQILFCELVRYGHSPAMPAHIVCNCESIVRSHVTCCSNNKLFKIVRQSVTVKKEE
jgi:hypothetical protein